MKFTYYNPVKIRFGVDYLEAIKDLASKLQDVRFLLVTSKGFSKRGISDRIGGVLGSQLVGIIDEILPNPQLKHLQEIKAILCDFDAIIALGGGSVIDSAKFLSVPSNSPCGNSCSGNHSADLGIFGVSQTLSLASTPKIPKNHESTTATPSVVDSANTESKCYQNANSSIVSETQRVASEAKQKSGLCSHERGNKTDLSMVASLCSQILRIDEESGKLPDLSPQDEFVPTQKPIYAIPTTSGTSSELTHWATIWDNDAFIKHSLSDESLYPKEAIYDPRLTLSLPRETTIHTALDALSHSFESIWNNNANPISTHYALMAIEIILRDLGDLAQNLDSLPLRTSIMQASIYAGLAFSNTQTALAHAISYPLTMKYGTPHGLACSFSLPLLLKCLPPSEARDLLLPFKTRLLGLFEKLEISTLPKDYGLDSAFINEIFATLNARAKNGIFAIEGVKNALLKYM